MSEKTHVYLPIKSEDDNRIGFARKAIAELTEKDKAFITACNERKAQIELTQVRQDPKLMELMLAYVNDSEWFAVEGKQINEM